MEFTIVIMIKILSVCELPSNVNIFTKLVAEIKGLLPGQFGYGHERVDLLCLLLTPQVLQRDVSHGDELGREVPVGVGVDEVPLLGVDLSAAGLLSHLLLRHHPGQQTIEREAGPVIYHLSHTLMSAMIPMKGFLSKEYRPTIRTNSSVFPAPVMMLPSYFPTSQILTIVLLII